jgi:hypothetical protein
MNVCCGNEPCVCALQDLLGYAGPVQGAESTWIRRTGAAHCAVRISQQSEGEAAAWVGRGRYLAAVGLLRKFMFSSVT